MTIGNSCCICSDSKRYRSIMRSALERRIREKYLKIAHIIAKYAFFYLNIKRSLRITVIDIESCRDGKC